MKINVEALRIGNTDFEALFRDNSSVRSHSPLAMPSHDEHAVGLTDLLLTCTPAHHG
jgi:hypothetical protein